MKKHTKHSQIARPSFGKYARKEWGIIGAPCGIIQELAKNWSAKLQGQMKVGYLDASHKKEHLEGTVHSDFDMQVEKQGNALQSNTASEPSHFGYRRMFQEADLLLVNGNHFESQQQIVVLDPGKLDSLLRKLDRLTDIILLIDNGLGHIPDFIQKRIGDGVPFIHKDETDIILSYLRQQITPAPIYSLILNGGKSTRMGQDKSTLDYHGKSQLDYLHDILSTQCERTFVSVSEQKGSQGNYEIIEDQFKGLGAYGGILSALMKHPDAAWLVVAIDMPNINGDSISEIISKRNTSKCATAFLNPETQFPDPLFTIFEPKSYGILLHYLSMGYACPRKMLINEDVHVIQPNDAAILLNINTPEEREEFLVRKTKRQELSEEATEYK